MKLWLTRWKSVFRLFGVRSRLVAAAGGIVALVLIGIPSGIIENPFLGRETLVRPQDYVIWLATGILAGLVAGTFTLPAKKLAGTGGRVVSGGFLSFLAIGCPICNTLVVSLLGVSGALAFFAPLQIYLGIASLALLIWALHLRVRAIYGSCCAVPQAIKARETYANK